MLVMKVNVLMYVCVVFICLTDSIFLSESWNQIRAVVSTQDGSHTCCCRAALLLCVLKAEGLTLNRGGCAPLRRLFCLLLLTWETPLLTLSKLNQQFRNCPPTHTFKRLHLCSYSVLLSEPQNHISEFTHKQSVTMQCDLSSKTLINAWLTG